MSIPNKFVNLFVPICSNPLLISGWNITTSAITPEGKNAVKTECTIVKLSIPLSHVIRMNEIIPFINCNALEPFAIWNIFTTINMTIAKSKINDTSLIGYSCNNLKYSDILLLHVDTILVIKFSFIFCCPFFVKNKSIIIKHLDVVKLYF